MHLLDTNVISELLVYEMTAVTRNVADFAPTGVATANPWE